MSVVSILRIRRIRMLPMLRPIYSHSFWLEFHYWSMGFLVFFQYKQLIAEWLINKWYDQLKPTWLNRTWRFVKLWINNAARMAGKWLIPGQFWSNFQSNFQSISKAWKTAEKKKKKWIWRQTEWTSDVEVNEGDDDWWMTSMGDWKIGRRETKGTKESIRLVLETSKKSSNILNSLKKDIFKQQPPITCCKVAQSFFSLQKTFNNKTNSNKRSQAK